MKGGFAGADVVETDARPAARGRGAAAASTSAMRRGPREFSWFIFRVSSPTMRDFFMYPQNPLRVKEALLSLLAGDIYGKTPIWPSILAMKTMYYLVSLGNLAARSRLEASPRQHPRRRGRRA